MSLICAAFILLWVGADVLQAISHSSALYTYLAPPPYACAHSPPLPTHTHNHAHVNKRARAHPNRLKVAVTGHVFCDACKDGKKQPLKGVTVGVLCGHGKLKQSFYGTTNKLGNFKVKLAGYHYRKHGGTKSCRVKLISPSHATTCWVPTNLHSGKLGAPLRITSKTLHEVVLQAAGPFAYTSYTPSKTRQCYKSPSYKHGPKPPSGHSRVHEKYENSSCPAYQCKSTTPSSNTTEYVRFITSKQTHPRVAYKGIQFITSKHKPPHATHKGLAPKSQSSLYPPPPTYLTYKKKH